MTAPTLTPKQAKAILKELASVAEHASLTGAYSDGLSSARDKINWLMAWAEAQQIAPTGFFRPLTDTARWGEIGVEARMMMASIKDVDEFEEDDDFPLDEDDDEVPSDDEGRDYGFIFGEGLGRKLKKLRKLKHLKHVVGPGRGIKDPGVLVAMAPFLDSDDLAALVMEHMEEGGDFDEGLLVALAPFLGSQTLGRLVRSRMKRKPARPEAPSAPEPPAPPAPAEEPKIPEAYPAPEAASIPRHQPNWTSAPAWTQNEGNPLNTPDDPQTPTLPPGSPQ